MSSCFYHSIVKGEDDGGLGIKDAPVREHGDVNPDLYDNSKRQFLQIPLDPRVVEAQEVSSEPRIDTITPERIKQAFPTAQQENSSQHGSPTDPIDVQVLD